MFKKPNRRLKKIFHLIILLIPLSRDRIYSSMNHQEYLENIDPYTPLLKYWKNFLYLSIYIYK